MSFAEALVLLLHGQSQIRRAYTPHITYELDGAEGGTIWRRNEKKDEAAMDATFGLTDLCATDWQFCPPRSTEFLPRKV